MWKSLMKMRIALLQKFGDRIRHVIEFLKIADTGRRIGHTSGAEREYASLKGW